MTRYQDVLSDLQAAYDFGAARRETNSPEDWKLDQRGRFLDLLRSEGTLRLLEIGAGVGRDSLFFQEGGLDVVATDLSPEMVRLCRQKGIEAYVMDFMGIDFPEGSCDALYAFNTLLHVPSADFLDVLGHLRGLLKPGGLFFLGQYGGTDFEGIAENDFHRPQRFFCRYSDERMEGLVSQVFEIASFESIDVEFRDGNSSHFQAAILRKPVP